MIVMATELIKITEYCIHHHADIGFIEALEQSGLIRIVVSETDRCIEYEQLPLLESYTRWHYDLDINVEGIEAIQHLLSRMTDMQEQLHRLQEQLHRYEAGNDEERA